MEKPQCWNLEWLFGLEDIALSARFGISRLPRLAILPESNGKEDRASDRAAFSRIANASLCA